MAETPDQDKRRERESSTRPRASSRTPAIVISLTFFALAFISAATAYALSNVNRGPDRSPHETALAVPIPDPIISATLKNIQLAQQQNAAVLEQLTQSSATQQTGLKKISDQLSSLAARADALLDTPLTTSTIPEPNDRARAIRSIKAPQKKMSSLLPKPLGPVSVGGAPLSPAPANGLQTD